MGVFSYHVVRKSMVRFSQNKLTDVIRFLLTMPLVLGGLAPRISAQVGVDDPTILGKRIFILQDFVDNYEHGLVAGSEPGEHRGFGNDLDDPGFELVEGQGLNRTTAAELSTDADGFGEGPSIGFSKKFSIPIDASDFSSISYWIKNKTDNSDSSATARIELVVGDGGRSSDDPPLAVKTGSTWSQTQAVQLSTLPTSTNTLSGFSRITVGLSGILGQDPGEFTRTVLPTDPTTQTSLAELLGNISAINLVMESNGDTGGVQRAIYVDNVAFIAPPFNLTVNSFPFDGVDISGDVTDTTPFTKLDFANENEEFTICAPRISSNGTNELTFDAWLLDGASMAGEVDTTNNQNCLTFTLFQNSLLIADYVPSTFQLAVESTPASGGVSIAGTHEGETPYSQTVNVGTRVRLEAPPKIDSQRLHFLQWRKSVEGQAEEIIPERQNVITFDLDENTTVTAEYAAGDVLVTVTSIPATGIPIGGTQGGTTDYSIALDRDTTDPVIQLTAPSTHQLAGVDVELEFKQWFVIENNTTGSTVADESLSIPITDDTTIVAVYDHVWELQEGWNLISTPVSVDNTDAQTELFSQADGRPVWFWNKDSQRYEVADMIEPGNGYWVFMQNEVQIKVPGELTPSTIPVAKGWNLVGVIGNQFIPDPNALSTFEPQPGTDSVVWTWDSAQQKLITVSDKNLQLFRQNTLVPGMGYWVFLKQ